MGSETSVPGLNSISVIPSVPKLYPALFACSISVFDKIRVGLKVSTLGSSKLNA